MRGQRVGRGLGLGMSSLGFWERLPRRNRKFPKFAVGPDPVNVFRSFGSERGGGGKHIGEG